MRVCGVCGECVSVWCVRVSVCMRVCACLCVSGGCF